MQVATRVSAGASTVQLTGGDLAAGDMVAISSGPSFTTHTITSGAGKTFATNPPLPKDMANSVTVFSANLTLDTRAEVALVSRSVRISGSPMCRVLVTDLTIGQNVFRYIKR